MNRTLPRYPLGLLLVVGLLGPLTAADPTPPDLSEYKTVATATTTAIRSTGPIALGQTGYLGVFVASGTQSKVVVAEVGPESPAEKAGLQKDDIILKVGGHEVRNADIFRETLLSHKPDEDVKLAILRKGKPLELTAKLGATSKPMQYEPRGGGGRPGRQRPMLGISVGDGKEGDGFPVTQVTANSPAAKAGLKVGELILKIDGKAITEAGKIGDTVREKRPGDSLTLTIKRDDKPVDLKVVLAVADAPEGRGGSDSLPVWQKPVFKLAVICVEYPDAKHNAKITVKDWQDSLFSRDAYKNKNNATGQTVYGSLADYYHELSCGGLKIEGKVFDWVELKNKRMEYAPGSGTGSKTPLLTEALDKIVARDGKDALKDFDGLLYVYAGERAGQNRGSLYWPHRGSFRHDNKIWSYFLCSEGGSRMTNVSLLGHEFGLMLGLPELSARPENAGSKGAGVWCAMSNQVDTGKPQHLCAWAKEQLGWIKPAVIDPTVKQKLILSPIEGNTKECFKVLLKLDGSEYLLLENRRKKGYDESLPAEGLLIWRVVHGKPILVESHGVESPSSPRMFVDSVPYPSKANDSFTPYSTPSSRAQLGGGLPVNITNIRRLPDGRVTFHIGYEYQ